MIFSVPNRQSPEEDSVREAVGALSPEDQVTYVAERIRDAMERRGWTDALGKPDVKRLADAMGVRWQTAQYWVEARNKQLPRPDNLRRIAEALGMTLEQLIGAASGQEPETDAWRSFVQSDLGGSMTQAERQALASMLWPNGDPDTAAYRMVLLTLRSVAS